MRERELDVNILTLVQINAFVTAAEKGVLDDAMVAEFVRQLKLNEQWKKSTINVEDPRAAAATSTPAARRPTRSPRTSAYARCRRPHVFRPPRLSSRGRPPCPVRPYRA